MHERKSKTYRKKGNEKAAQRQEKGAAGKAQIADNRSEAAAQRKLKQAVDGTEETSQEPNNTGMPDQLKSGLESLSGMYMGDVKVHYNSQKPAQLNAEAYAQGSEIHLGPGQEKHLPHEAWHTVQQKQGRVKPTTKVKGANVNDNVGLEKEADEMGSKAVQMRKRGNPFNSLERKPKYSAFNRKEKTVQRQIRVGEGEDAQNYSFVNKFDNAGNPYLVDKDKKFRAILPRQPKMRLGDSISELPRVSFDDETKKTINKNIARGRAMDVTFKELDFTMYPLMSLSQDVSTAFDIKVSNAAGKSEMYDNIAKSIIKQVKDLAPDSTVEAVLDVIESELNERVLPLVAMAEDRRNPGSIGHYEKIRKTKIKRIKKIFARKGGFTTAKKDAIAKLISEIVTGPKYAGSGGKKEMAKHLGNKPAEYNERMDELSELASDVDMASESEVGPASVVESESQPRAKGTKRKQRR